MPEYTWNPQDIRDNIAVLGTTWFTERATIRNLVLALDADYEDAAGQVVRAEADERAAVAAYADAELVKITAVTTDPGALVQFQGLLMRQAYLSQDVLAKAYRTSEARMILAVHEHRLKLLEVLKDIVVAHTVAEKGA